MSNLSDPNNLFNHLTIDFQAIYEGIGKELLKSEHYLEQSKKYDNMFSELKKTYDKTGELDSAVASMIAETQDKAFEAGFKHAVKMLMLSMKDIA